jgi:Spy/CpxP family protein refolding chaperone
MRIRRAFFIGAALAISAATLGTQASSRASSRTPADPLADEIDRWSRFAKEHKSSDENWVHIQKATEPALAEARAALAAGRRNFALQRLGAARALLSASAYVDERSEGERNDEAAFERERERMAGVLRADLTMPSAASFDGVRPAAVRATGEASLPQVKIFYDTSLEYARNTMPDAGLFYIGEARAQGELAALCRRLSESATGKAPPLRALGPELDALEARLLAAYQPPASIDRHSDFIGASSRLKEARELDAAGLRYGAMLRYLQTVQAVALLSPASAPVAAEALPARLAELDRALAAPGVDHTIGRTFLESAQAELDERKPALERAPAIVTQVLPAYFAALSPARPAPPRPPARVTVTLVRWPYT